jgi:hypothetical protein
MTAQTLPISAVVKALSVAHFPMMDRLRRAHGDALDALGLGPREGPFQLISSERYWRLRDAAPLVLMVPAPIKRPYIWEMEGCHSQPGRPCRLGRSPPH